MKITTLIALLVYASTSFAVKFHSYTNEQGETVFSNVPQNCIKNSSLTCLEYHPVLSNKATNPERKTHQDQFGQKANRPTLDKSGNNNLLEHLGSTEGLQPDILNRIIEVNRLLNEYYPAKPDPGAARKVRQQQEGILDVLQVIRNTAGDTEKPIIDRAIDVLRSRLVQ